MLIACLGRATGSGGGASSHKGNRVNGSSSTWSHLQAQCSIPMHIAGERASIADPAPDSKRRDTKSRPPTSKAPFATHCSGDGVGNKPPAHLGSSGPMKAAPLLRTKALHTLQGMKDM